MVANPAVPKVSEGHLVSLALGCRPDRLQLRCPSFGRYSHLYVNILLCEEGDLSSLLSVLFSLVEIAVNIVTHALYCCAK